MIFFAIAIIFDTVTITIVMSWRNYGPVAVKGATVPKSFSSRTAPAMTGVMPLMPVVLIKSWIGGQLKPLKLA